MGMAIIMGKYQERIDPQEAGRGHVALAQQVQRVKCWLLFICVTCQAKRVLSDQKINFPFFDSNESLGINDVATKIPSQ